MKGWKKKQNEHNIQQKIKRDAAVSSTSFKERAGRIDEHWKKGELYVGVQGASAQNTQEKNIILALKTGGIVARPALPLSPGESRKSGLFVREAISLGTAFQAWIEKSGEVYYLIASLPEERNLISFSHADRKILLALAMEAADACGDSLIIQEGVVGISGTDPHWDGSEYFVCQKCGVQHPMDQNVFDNLVQRSTGESIQ